MARYAPLVGVALGVFLFYRLVQFLFLQRKRAAAAKQLGCKPLPRLKMPWYDPAGITGARAAMKASNDQVFPHLVWERTMEVEKEVNYPNPTYMFNILGSETVLTTDPKNVQAVLATQFKDFAIPSSRNNNLVALLGHGIFTSNGKAWEHSRAMIRPSFARERVGDLDLNERHVANLQRAIPVNKSTGWTEPIDLLVLFFRLTIDSSTEFLFGESVDSQLNELGRSQQPNDTAKRSARDEQVFAASFDKSQLYLAKRGRLQERYWLINPRDFRDACRDCHDFIDHYVELALKQRLKEKDPEKAHGGRDKSQYIFLEELAQQTQDPIELRSQLLNVLLAGRDTTSSLLAWLFYSLARNHDKFNKLREEVLQHFGRPGQESEITFAKLKGCNYLQWCLNETLRLFPSVPINSRQAVTDTTLPTGGGPDGKSPIFVPKGQNVVYSVYVMQRHPHLWGEDAHEFRPERWDGRRHDWSYTPFNGGPRICLGQQFALTAAGFAVVRLMQRFDAIENLDHDEIVLQNATLTMHPAKGVQVKLHQAPEAS